MERRYDHAYIEVDQPTRRQPLKASINSYLYIMSDEGAYTDGDFPYDIDLRKIIGDQFDKRGVA